MYYCLLYGTMLDWQKCSALGTKSYSPGREWVGSRYRTLNKDLSRCRENPRTSQTQPHRHRAALSNTNSMEPTEQQQLQQVPQALSMC